MLQQESTPPVYYGYWKGTERPNARKGRLCSVVIPSTQMKMDAAEAVFRSFQLKMQVLHEEVSDISTLTEGGRYNRDVEDRLHNRGLMSLNERLLAAGLPVEVEKRGPGRPRKYEYHEGFRRPSRAKTAAGLKRAYAIANARRQALDVANSAIPMGFDNSSNIASASTDVVDVENHEQLPVAEDFASDHRTVEDVKVVEEDKDSPFFGAEYLKDFDAFNERFPSGTYNAFLTARNNKIRTHYEKTNNIAAPAMLSAKEAGLLDQPDEDPGITFFGLDPESTIARNTYIRNEARLRDYSAKDFEGSLLKFDFSQPDNEASMPAIVKKVFPCIGLPMEWPPVDPKTLKANVSEDVLRKWAIGAIMPELSEKEAGEQLEDQIRYYGCIERFVRKRPFEMEESLYRERARPYVLDAIQYRKKIVELAHWYCSRGKASDIDCKIFVAYTDFLMLSSIPEGYQHCYDEIVNDLPWHEGYSRNELRAWAGDPLDAHHAYRSYELFPHYMFPEHLRDYAGANMPGYFMEYDYDLKIPSDEEIRIYDKQAESKINMDDCMKIIDYYQNNNMHERALRV